MVALSLLRERPARARTKGAHDDPVHRARPHDRDEGCGVMNMWVACVLLVISLASATWSAFVFIQVVAQQRREESARREVAQAAQQASSRRECPESRTRNRSEL